MNAARILTIQLFLLYCFQGEHLAFAGVPTVCPWHDPSDLHFDPPTDAAAPTTPIPVAQLQEDLACLRIIFQREYIASHFYAEQKIDLVKRLDAFSSALKDPLLPAEFARQLLPLHQDANDVHLAYMTLQNDKLSSVRQSGHKIYVVKLLFTQSNAQYVAIDPQSNQEIHIKNCPGFKPEPALGKATSEANQFLFVRQYNQSAPSTVTCETPDGSPRTLAISELKLDLLPGSAAKFHFEETPEGYLYVRIPSMTPGISSDQQKLLDLLSEPTYSKPIIFDVRQNRGGDDTFAVNLASTLRANDDTLPGLSIENMGSLYSAASSPNINLLIAHSLDQSGDAAGAEIYRRSAKDNIEKYNKAVASGLKLDDFEFTQQSFPPQRGSRAKAYPKPIILLIDKLCASSCESMLEKFSGAPNVYLLGSHTAGAVHFGNVGVMMLPHSKVMFYGGWRGFKFASGVAEGIGYEPDFYVLAEDTLAAAVRFLKTKTTPALSSF